MELGEGGGNGLVPAFLFVVYQNGAVVDTVFLSRITVAGGITDHEHLIGVIAEFQHGGNTGSFGADVLCQHNIGVFQKTELAPFLFHRIPVSRGHHGHICKAVGSSKTLPGTVIGYLQAFVQGNDCGVDCFGPGQGLF